MHIRTLTASFLMFAAVLASAGSGPREIIMKSGDYTAELESRFAWTLHKLHYKGSPLLVNSGWMGSVIRSKVAKGEEPFTGTGHGGETIKDFKLLVDGKAVRISGKSTIVKGRNIQAVKTSMIGPLLHHSILTLTPQGLEQEFDFEVKGDMSKVLDMYLFMSIWNKSNDIYLAKSEGEKLVQGSFRHDNKFIQTRQNRWVALLDGKSGIAGICVYDIPAKCKSLFWDRKVDNKHYIKYYPPKEQGAAFSCKSMISAFESTRDEFAADASSAAETIISGNSQNKVSAMQTKLMKNITGPEDFVIEQPVVKSKTVSAADFGLNPDGTGQENVAALQKTIDFCKENKINKLIIPKGKYRFLKTAVDKRDQGKKQSHYLGRLFTINLIGMKDFVFDGQGSEFIFEDLDYPRGKEILGGFFRLLQCERVLLKNFIIDWDWDRMPLGFYGKIVKVDPEKLTIDYKVSYNGKPIPKDFHVYAVRGWDPAINNRTTKAFEFYWKISKSHEMIGPHTLRFTFTNAAQIKKAKVGMWAVFKSKTHFFAVGFTADENKHLSLDNVNIYGVPSSGMWARRNKYLSITNCKIMPRPGTEKVWASHSGFEIHNSLGYFRMENNHLEFTHDDGLHFSDFFLGGGIKRLGPKKLDVLNLMYWQAGDVFIVGDTYEFRNRDYSPTGFKAKLLDFKWTINNRGVAKHFVTCEFDREIPDSIKDDCIIFNISSYGKGQYVIRNNTFKNNLTHGMEVLEPNGIIENNRITDSSYPAIRIHSVIRWTRWHMGHPPRNIIVRNNFIERANSALRPPADLFIGGGIDPQKGDYYSSPYPIVRNVLVENNTIKFSQWQAMAIWSAENIIVRDNKIFNSNRLPNKKNYGGAIDLDNVRNVLVTGNEWHDDGKAQDNGIHIHLGTGRNVVVSGNKNMELKN